jgi:hydrogenase/urease accessory protein HupE
MGVPNAIAPTFRDSAAGVHSFSAPQRHSTARGGAALLVSKNDTRVPFPPSRMNPVRRPERTFVMAKALVAVCAFLFLVALAPRAHAHAIGLSTGDYRTQGSSVAAKLAFARGEVAALARGVDQNEDGHLTAAEVAASKSLLEEKILKRIVVRAGDSSPCTVAITDAGLTDEDGLLVGARWDCNRADVPYEIELAILDDLARGHRHVARTASADGAVHDEVLFGDTRRLTLVPSAAPPSEKPVVHEASAWSFLKMGIEHILTGYDHLVFIVGLVLARARLRSLLTIVTAFTIAHSITLALAALDVWSPSPRIVEPAIALSIAYVGIENFFVKDASKRWRITFPFGLIHGFGFAGALREIALPRASVPTALVSFNLGVEAGQLAVLAVLLPVILLLRDRSWFEPKGVRILSGAVALAGGIWFVARLVSPGG